MTTDRLRFEIGSVTEFTAPNGRRYFRGDIGGLRVTLVDEPDRDPAAGGQMRLSVWASPAPGKARHVRVPAPDAPPAEQEPAVFHNSRAMTKAERERAAAKDVIARHGPIPPGGDSLDDAFLPLLDPDLAEAMRALETPLI